MRRKMRGRETLRERIIKNNAADRWYAAMAGKDPMFQQEVPPERKRPATRGSDGRPLESDVNKAIKDIIDADKTLRVWRNNRGLAEYGNVKVKYGVGPNGAADWIGYRVVKVTQDMVGKSIAQFVALEAKRPGEKPDANQQWFIDRTKAEGGAAGWADSGDVAKQLLEEAALKEEAI